MSTVNLEARDRLVEENVRLAAWFAGKAAKKYAGKIDYDEAQSLANLALVKAAEGYDPEKGAKFATYATAVMQNECLMYLRKLRKEPQGMISLDAPTLNADGEATALLDCIADESSEFECRVADRDLINGFMRSLNAADRSLLLRHIQGEKQELISNDLNLSQSMVSRKIKQIQKKGRRYAMAPSHKQTPPADRATTYNRLRSEGYGPDEAAQKAGWKNFRSAQAALAKAGVKISAKVSRNIETTLPAGRPATINQNFEALFDSPSGKGALTKPECGLDQVLPNTQCNLTHCYMGDYFMYIPYADKRIELKPLSGDGIVLHIHEIETLILELQELLRIVK